VNRAFLSRGLQIAAIAATLASCRPEHVGQDLTAALASARRQPADRAFDIVDAVSDRGTMRCIRTRGATRLTYHVTVPSRATLSVWLPVVPADGSDGGVVYLIGVSDGHTYRTVAGATTQPASRESSTKWRNLRFSLDEYASMTINVMLNTRVVDFRTGPFEVGLWCSPEVRMR